MAAATEDQQLDTVQHPTLGTLKFPKEMAPDERNESIERTLLSRPDAQAPPAVPKPQTNMEGTFGERLRNAPNPGSFEGHPENIGEYIPRSAGEMAGGVNDIAHGRIARGGHRVISGVGNAALPALPFVAAAAPAATARALTLGTAGAYAGSNVAKDLGATPDQADLAGDITGIASGGLGAKPRIATAPIRLAARGAEAAANQKLLPVKPILKIMTPADEAGELKLRIPGRDFGLKSPRPVYPGAPLPENPGPLITNPSTAGAHLPEKPAPEILEPAIASPARTLPGMHSREQTIPTGYGSPLPPRSIPREGPLLLSGKVQPTPQARIARPSVPPPEKPLGAPAPTGEATADPWIPAAPSVQWPRVGSPEDLAETRDIQGSVRDQSESEMGTLRRLGNEEGYARNTRQGTPKSVLTGTANRPVKYTSTPGARGIGKGSPAAGSSSEEDLTPILEKSLKQAKKTKK